MPPSPAATSIPAMLAAVLSAIAASVCCVLPLVLVLLGISGAWIANLTALEPWRPWLSAFTLLLLGVAFWSLYGPPARCQAEGVCTDMQARKRRRLWLWLATFLAAALLLFPYYVAWLL